MASNPDPMHRPDRPLPYYAPIDTGGDGSATASLVLGIIGLVCAIIPVIGLISWLLSPAAIITGILGMKSERSKGMAIGGLVTGILGLIVCLIWTIFFGVILASVGSARDF